MGKGPLKPGAGRRPEWRGEPLELRPLAPRIEEAPVVSAGPESAAGMAGAEPAERVGWIEGAGWLLLAGLLLATLAGTLVFSRAGHPSLVGDEATYAMQAASLAWDFDLAYTRADYDRFIAQWGRPPDGVILQSRDGGAHITYGKPFLYALAVAPFVRASPQRGPLVANALMLAAAALLAARTLRQRIGRVAPAWVAVLVFGSVAFAYVFWVHADVFLCAATAAGYAVAYGGDRSRRPPGTALPQLFHAEAAASGRWRLLGRWALAGLLLAIPAAFRPFYLVLLVPAAFAVPRERRREALAGLAAGALCLLLLTSAVQWGAGGSWSGYGGERRGFYAATGYPGVDFPLSDWSRTLRQWGNTSWVQEGAFEPVWSARLWGWNTLYFLVGRNVGVLPYFLPLVLGLLAYRGDRGRWAILAAVALGAAGFLLVRPFNFYGGGGAIGNRYFLPLYPALWYLAGRPVRAVAPLLVAALAAPFLWPLWRNPAAFPVGDDGRYRHVSAAAEALLPYETTQSHIPGGQDASAHGLWTKLLDRNVARAAGGAMRVTGAGRAEILVASPRPLDGLTLELDARAPARLVVGGRELRPVLLRPDGSMAFDVPLGRPRAVHPMWWTKEDIYLYELAFSVPGAKAGAIGLEVLPERHVGPSSPAGGVGGAGSAGE